MPAETTFAMNPVILTIVGIYLLGMLYIGYYASKKIKGNVDFMVAGRRLGPFLLAGTLAATEVGGGSSRGVAEKAFGDWGLSAGWYVLTLAITFLVLAFWAPSLRRAMVKTVPEYFYKRYGEPSGLLTAVMMVLPLIGLTAIQMIASAVILSAMTGMSYVPALCIVVVIVTIYSVMGGLWSVTLTDAVQWCLIILGLAIAIPFALHAVGGWSKFIAITPPEKMSITGGIGYKTIISLVIIYVTSFAVGQEVNQRYFAARDGRTARTGSLLTSAVYFLFAFIPALLGIIAFTMVQQGLIGDGLIQEFGTRYVLPVLIRETMPPWIVGVVFAALISATMSSADSDLLAAGSIFSNDIYAKVIRKTAGDREILIVTRLGMIVIALLSMVVALVSTDNLITLLMFSFALRAGGVFFPYILGHYWKKAGAAGTIASIILGSIAILLVKYNVVSIGGFDPVIAGLAVSLAVFIPLSLISPGQKKPTGRSIEE